MSPSEQLEQLLDADPDELVARVRSAIEPILRSHDHSFILFGTGELGRIALRNLRRLGKPPVAFADNNPAQQGATVEGVPVMAPEEAQAKFPRSLFVVTVYTNSPVHAQLDAMGAVHITFAQLAWCYSDAFLPRCALELPHKIFENADKVREAAKVWADDSSRAEYVAQIAWRCTLYPAALPAHAPASETYFPADLFQLGQSDVLVDCGAFDGDTARAFLARSKQPFQRFIGLEPDPKNRERFTRWHAGLASNLQERIELLPFASGESRGRVSFSNDGEVTSTVGTGPLEVDVAPLDELVGHYSPTFVKMDIEGAEPGALRGTREILGRDQPILAVCLYHAQEHLWEIPLLIQSLNPRYQLFLRRHSDECWELVCYAIPAERTEGL